MSDNIVDFNAYKNKRQTLDEVVDPNLDEAVKHFSELPDNKLMDKVGAIVNDKLSRLLMLADIGKQVTQLCASFGFDVNGFVPEERSLEHYMTARFSPDEDAEWNGPWFDWRTKEFIVRIVTTIVVEEDADGGVVPTKLFLECFRLVRGNDYWQSLQKKQWIDEGPDDDEFDYYFDYVFDTAEESRDEDWLYPGFDEDTRFFININYGVYRVLHGAGVDTIEALTKMTEAQLLALKGIGPKMLEKIKNALAERGLKLKE